MGIWDGLKRGVGSLAGSSDPRAYAAGGLKVSCAHCDSDRFREGRALLNTAGMTFMNLDWANKEATTLTCARCGFIQWFANRPEPIPAKPRAMEEWPDV